MGGKELGTTEHTHTHYMHTHSLGGEFPGQIGNVYVSLKKLPGFPGPVVENSLTMLGDLGSILSLGTKIPRALGASKPEHCDY